MKGVVLTRKPLSVHSPASLVCIVVNNRDSVSKKVEGGKINTRVCPLTSTISLWHVCECAHT